MWLAMLITLAASFAIGSILHPIAGFVALIILYGLIALFDEAAR